MTSVGEGGCVIFSSDRGDSLQVFFRDFFLRKPPCQVLADLRKTPSSWRYRLATLTFARGLFTNRFRIGNRLPRPRPSQQIDQQRKSAGW